MKGRHFESSGATGWRGAVPAGRVLSIYIGSSVKDMILLCVNLRVTPDSAHGSKSPLGLVARSGRVARGRVENVSRPHRWRI